MTQKMVEQVIKDNQAFVNDLSPSDYNQWLYLATGACENLKAKMTQGVNARTVKTCSSFFTFKTGQFRVSMSIEDYSKLIVPICSNIVQSIHTVAHHYGKEGYFVFITGGNSKNATLRSQLKEKFGEQLVEVKPESEEVAIGGVMASSNGEFNIEFTQHTHQRIGLVLDDANSKNGKVLELIPKHTPLHSNYEKSVPLNSNVGELVKFTVVEGASTDVSKCRVIASFSLLNNAKNPGGKDFVLHTRLNPNGSVVLRMDMNRGQVFTIENLGQLASEVIMEYVWFLFSFFSSLFC